MRGVGGVRGMRELRARTEAAVAVATLLAGILVALPASADQTSVFTGRVDAGGDRWEAHTFEVTDPGQITASLDWDAPAADLNLFLKDPSGTVVASALSKTGRPENVSFDATATGTWKVAAKAITGAANYTLTADYPGTGPPPPPPPPPDSITETFVGGVDAAGDAWKAHSFQVTELGLVTATLEWDDPAVDLNLFLKDPGGTVVAKSLSKTERPETVWVDATATGPWKVAAKAITGAATYTITVHHSPGGTPPPGGGFATYSASFGFRGHAGLYAYGVDWDPSSGTWLVGDYWNYRVKRFGSAGAYQGIVSQGAARGATGGIKAPYDVEAVGDGTYWAADQENTRIVQFTQNGNWIQTIGLGGGPNPWEAYGQGCGGGDMLIPTHILADHPTTSNLFVSDPRCRDVYVFSADGHFLFDFDIDLRKYGIYTPLPRGIDADAAGNIYYVDHNARRIVVFDTNGNQLWESEQFFAMKDPRGLVIDRARNLLYVVAAFNNEVFQFDINPAAKTITLRDRWDSWGSTRLNTVRFAGVDPAGNVAVGDTWGYVVRRFDVNGNPLSWATPPAPPPNGGWNQVNGIGIDPVRRKLYGVDTFENRAQRFNIDSYCLWALDCPGYEFDWGSRDSAGEHQTGFSNPRALTFGDGSVWAEGSNSVNRYDPDGNFISRFGSKGTSPGQFKAGPKDIQIVGADGNPATSDGLVYATDSGNCRLQVFDYAGVLQKYMGGPCGNGSDQMLGSRQFDVKGNLAYVADSGHNRIAVWNTDTRHIVATITASFDGRKLSGPRGAVLDPTGTWLYIGDTNNRRVVRIRIGADGLTFTDPELVTTGKDTPEGNFKGPEYLEFGPDGRLFVSDNNQRIYAFTL